jgi:O-antigen ligase
MELGALIAYGQLGGTYVVAAGVATVLLSLGLLRPLWVILPVVLLLGVFSSTSLTAAAGSGRDFGFDVYGKGSGYLLFSLYELSFMFVALGVGLKSLLARGFDAAQRVGARRSDTSAPVRNLLVPWYGLFGVVLLGWALHYSLVDEAGWLLAVSRNGIVYIVMQGVLMVALLGALRDERDLRLLMGALAAAVALRMAWGLVRYALLGGDPSNFYATDGNRLRITFWDINDSMLAIMLACSAIWLAATLERLKPSQRLLLLAVALLSLAVAALSARRTAQTGMLLALLALWVLLPRGRRWWIGGLFLLLVPMVLYKLQSRLDDQAGLRDLFSLRSSQQVYFHDPRFERSYELRAAMATVRENWLFGVGPAGSFNPPSHVGLAYHQGNYAFVHSGIVHVLLKTGVVGLLVFMGLLGAWARQWWQQWQHAPPRWRALLVASLAGAAAHTPNLIGGTPFIELRTTLLMGLVLALPVLVARTVARQAGAAPNPAHEGLRSWRPGALHRARMRMAWKRA